LTHIDIRGQGATTTMGQNLMHWTMPAGWQFEEAGPGARDRRHVTEARQARAQQVGVRHRGVVATLAAFAVLGSLDRPNPAGPRFADCCAAA
jgi:hypothetical protein